MAYITLDQAKQYLGDLYKSAYINVSTEVLDDTILQEDIDSVTSVVDNYVQKLYQLPITGTVSLATLRDISEKLIYSKAYERYDSSEEPDLAISRYDRAIFRLKDISSGDLLLTDEIQNPRASGFNYSFNSPNSDGTGRTVFDRNSMSGV